MNNPIIEQIPLSAIQPSKTNPRKHFSESHIADLSESIRQRGIIVPMMARPDWCIGKNTEDIARMNGAAPTSKFFEIIAGECRYRGAVIAELADAPVIVRAVSDQETLELQLIENLQRADLDAFEEAEGYHRLLELRDAAGAPVHTVESIARRLNKPRQRIYYRLKLLRVPKNVREAVLNGLSVEIGEMIGGIPMPDLRAQAAAEILKPEHEVGPLSVRRAREVIAERYMRSLAGAPFDLKDASLQTVLEDPENGERIGGGACGDCPMRTGNMEAMIGKTKRPDVCTNPGCYRLKCDAQFARLQATAAAEGKRLMTEEEVTFHFEADGRLDFGSDLVLLAQQPDLEDFPGAAPAKRTSWKKLLEGLEAHPEIIIARDPRGRIVELVDRDLAIEAVKLAAKQRGEKSIFDSEGATPGASSQRASAAGRAGTGEEPEWKKQERKNREIAKVNFQITLRAMDELALRMVQRGLPKAFWDALIETSIEHAGHDGCWLICKRLELDPKAKNKHTELEGVAGAALEYGLSLPENEKLGFVVELLVSQQVKIYNSGSLGGVTSVESFMRFAKLYQLDLPAIEKQVRAEMKEKAKPKKAAAAAKGQSDIKAAATGTVEHKWDWNSASENGDGSMSYQCKACGASGTRIENAWPPVVDTEFLEKPCVKSEAGKKKRRPMSAAAKAKISAGLKGNSNRSVRKGVRSERRD